MSRRSQWCDGERSGMIDLAGLRQPLALWTAAQASVLTHSQASANVSRLPIFICIFVKRPVSCYCEKYTAVCVWECVFVCACALSPCLSTCVWYCARHFSPLTGQVPQGYAENASQWWVMATVCQRNRATEGDGGREADASRLLYRYCTNRW